MSARDAARDASATTRCVDCRERFQYDGFAEPDRCESCARDWLTRHQ